MSELMNRQETIKKASERQLVELCMLLADNDRDCYVDVSGWQKLENGGHNIII